jgi:hypothetical protein
MQEILRTGRIDGRGALFIEGGFEERKNCWTWFGEGTDEVKHHGEDYLRYFQSLPAVQAAWEITRRLADLQHRLYPHSWAKRGLKDKKTVKLCKLYNKVSDLESKLLNRVNKAVHAAAKTAEEKKMELSPTSYIVELHDVEGGFRYSGKHSLSGGKRRRSKYSAPEICFPKDAWLTLPSKYFVHLVKGGEVFGLTGPGELRQIKVPKVGTKRITNAFRACEKAIPKIEKLEREVDQALGPKRNPPRCDYDRVVFSDSRRAGKKRQAYFTDDGRHRTVHFGATGYQDYTMHHDPERRRRYLERHGRGREDWDRCDTAGSLSRWVLWGDSTSRAENERAFRKRFRLKNPGRDDRRRATQNRGILKSLANDFGQDDPLVASALATYAEEMTGDNYQEVMDEALCAVWPMLHLEKAPPHVVDLLLFLVSNLVDIGNLAPDGCVVRLVEEEGWRQEGWYPNPDEDLRRLERLAATGDPEAGRLLRDALIRAGKLSIYDEPAGPELPWVMFTKRTEDPKLAWLERRLDEAGIPHRRHGSSWHAPILQVPEYALDAAWEILDPYDDVEDDDDLFYRYNPPRARRALSRIRRSSQECYPAAEVVYHAGGGRRAGLTPVQQRHEGRSHWWVRGPRGEVLDPTASQFNRPVPYERGRGRGFLTRRPSKRARALAREAGIRLNPPGRDSADVILRKAQRYLAHDPGLLRSFLEDLGFADWSVAAVRPESRWRDSDLTLRIYSSPEDWEEQVEEFREDYEEEPWIAIQEEDLFFGVPSHQVSENPDVRLRELERRAAAGDHEAAKALFFARRRAGAAKFNLEGVLEAVRAMPGLTRQEIAALWGKGKGQGGSLLAELKRVWLVHVDQRGRYRPGPPIAEDWDLGYGCYPVDALSEVATTIPLPLHGDRRSRATLLRSLRGSLAFLKWANDELQPHLDLTGVEKEWLQTYVDDLQGMVDYLESGGRWNNYMRDTALTLKGNLKAMWRDLCRIPIYTWCPEIQENPNGHEGRRLTREEWDELVTRLLDEEGFTIVVAAEYYGVSPQAISRHLKVHRPYAHRAYFTRPWARRPREQEGDDYPAIQDLLL